MKIANIHIEGITKLYMHNGQLVDPLNRYVRAIAEITAKKTKKTDDDRERMARLEWEGSLYLDENDEPCIPGGTLEACIRDGAKETRKGKSVQAGMFVQEATTPLIYEGPRKVDPLWEDGRFTARDPVRVTSSKVIRCRPIFPSWSAKCSVAFDEGILSERELLGFVEAAGRMKGIGDWRPRHGRFVVKSFEVQ